MTTTNHDDTTARLIAATRKINAEAETEQQAGARFAALMNKPLTPAERYELHPDSALGGDGPWNNYGEDEQEGEPAEKVPFVWVNDGPPAHDFF